MVPRHRTNKILFWLGMSLPMVALLAMTWLIHQSNGEFRDSFRWVMKTYKVLNVVDQAQGHIADAESGLRGYLLTGREEYFEPYDAAKASITDDISQLETLTHGNTVQQANITALQSLVSDKLFFDPRKMPPAERNGTNVTAVILTREGKQTLDELERVLFQMRAEEENQLAQRQQSIESDALSGQIMSFVLIGAVALALVFIVFILLRLEKLQQFVTVCAWTGQVQYQGKWVRLDQYLKEHFGLAVSHSMSKDAAARMMHEIEELNRPGRVEPPDLFKK